MSENKGSVMVSAVSWSFLLFGGCHAARAAYDNYTLYSMFSSPSFMLGLAGSTLPVELPPLAILAAENIRLVFAAYLLVSLGVCATGFGLLVRKAWALAAARRIFYSAGVICGAIFLVPGLLVPKPILLDGVAVAPEFNAAVGWMQMQLRAIMALLGAAFLFAALRCERPGIKGEFGLAERPGSKGKI